MQASHIMLCSCCPKHHIHHQDSDFIQLQGLRVVLLPRQVQSSRLLLRSSLLSRSGNKSWRECWQALCPSSYTLSFCTATTMLTCNFSRMQRWACRACKLFLSAFWHRLATIGKLRQ